MKIIETLNLIFKYRTYSENQEAPEEKTVLDGVSLSVGKGDFVGILGHNGSGKSTFTSIVAGVQPCDSGEIILKGQKVELKRPSDAIRQGIAYVTEDRKGEGLVLPMSIAHNTTLPSMKEFSSKVFIRSGTEKKRTNEILSELKVKMASPRLAVKNLSGGNQQKVVLAKWMMKDPDVIIFDEPTRGIDVGAKAEIYKLMNEFVAKGKAVIMISSEMPEAMGMSDRILVISNHRLSGELSREEFSQDVIMKMAMRYM